MATPSAPEYSVSRRPLDVEDYIDILRRHRSWIIGPVFAGLVISVVVAFMWPDTYVSYATMRIVPPQVSENLVQNVLSTQMAERLNALKQDALSKGSLSSIIQSKGLYKKELQTLGTMEDVLEEMRKKIKIETVEAKGRTVMFQINFAYPDRLKAQAVVTELVALFMNNNTKQASFQTTTTTNFLNEEQRQAQEALRVLEERLTQFKLKHAGMLPEQMNANMQAQMSLQLQLGSIRETLGRLSQEKMVMETSMQNLKRQEALIAAGAEDSSQAAKNERLIQLNRSISDTELSLSGLRETYKEDHPDIRRFKAQLQVLKRERDALNKEDEAEQAKAKQRKTVNAQTARSLEEIRMTMASLNTQIQAKNLETEEKVKQQEQIQKSIQAYQARIEASPINEQNYASLLRETEFAKVKYEEMTRKKQMADTGAKIDTSKVGENLETIDTPTLPEQPTEPKRWMIAGMGLGIGLMLGLFLAGAKEMKDTSLKNLKDIRAYTNLTVLSSIPLLENGLVLRRKRRIFWLAWSSAILVGIVAMSSSMYYYYFVLKVAG